MAEHNKPVDDIGIVYIADPNIILAQNDGMHNGTLPYEDLRPYVELSCIYRKEGNFTVKADGTYNYDGASETEKINFLGFDLETKQYTVNYTDDIVGSTEERTSNEGFGIRDITITQNANHMPIVNIVFVDVKGASLYEPFVEGEKSPYAALHAYPPPLYNLKIKGAFGKFVELDLHMTNSNIEFDSVTGNMVVKCSFIGQYFGVLTDILIGYLKSVPYLMGEADKVMGEGDMEVNSFFELTQRGDLLYTKIEDYKNSSTSLAKKTTLETAKSDLKELKEWIVNNFTNIENIKNGLADTGVYNDLVVTVNGGIESDDKFSVVYTIPSTTGNAYDAVVSNIRRTGMLNYGHGLVKKMALLYPKFPKEDKDAKKIDYNTAVEITPSEELTGGDVQTKTHSVTLNLIKLTKEIRAAEASLSLSLGDTVREINSNLESITENMLGIRPSIGDVFRIICDDTDKFLGKLKEAGEAPKNETATDGSVVSMIPFPTVTEPKAINGDMNKMQTVFVYPGIYPQFQNWGECELVEKYCKALTDQQVKMDMVAHMSTQLDRTKYYPLSPIEDSFSALGWVNEYVLKTEPYQILKIAAMRYIISRDYTFRNLFDTFQIHEMPLMETLFANLHFFSLDQKKKFIRATGKVEGANAFNGISNLKTIEEITKMDVPKIIELLKKEAPSKNDHEGLLNIDYNQGHVKFRGKLDLYTKATTNADTYNNFEGIMGIVDGDDATYRYMLTPKTIASGSIDGERDAVLEDYGSVLSGWLGKDENERAVITDANTFLFRDSEKEPDNFESDFFPGDMVENLLINGVFKASSYKRRKAFGVEFYELMAKGEATNDELKASFVKSLTLTKWVPFNHSTIYGKFIIPGVIEMPRLYAIILGYTLGLVEHEGVDTKLSNGTIDYKRGQLPLDERTLSEKDRLKFKAIYDDFDIVPIIDEIREKVTNPNNFFYKINDKIVIEIGEYDDASSRFFGEFETIKKLIEPVYVINTSSQTFLLKDVYKGTTGFRSLFRDTNYSVKRKSVNTTRDPEGLDNSFEEYMKGFLDQFKKLAKDSASETKNKLDDIKSKINDPDFKTNVYYNFKMIYDRWIAGNSWAGKGLYDRFSFVTRSMQDISKDAIIDFSTLIDDAKSEDTSVFTAIAKVLQENNFSFFPLTSYIELQQGNPAEAWASSFQINNTLKEENIAKPKFVCMYIGAYSNNLATNNKDYPDDSVTFGVNQPEEFSILNGEAVFAFKARVGSQNQSIFTDLKLDTSEFKATDESLRIQDQIITTNQNSNPVRKSQNLMNIYSQRAYSCGMTIPFGNMCIQPTQYFQLEGIPIFNGAYMIYEVSHNIAAGSSKLVTTFKGNRINRHVFPIVTEYTLKYLGISSEFSEGSASNRTRRAFGSPKSGSPNIDIELSQNTINKLKDIRFKGI
jgi:hypothetical protein